MKNNIRAVLALAVAAGGWSGFTQIADAQISAPPQHDTRSETGASYRDGAFSWNEDDLSIGGEGGLSFSRTYISSSQDAVFSAGWTHNLYSFVKNEEVPVPPDTMAPPEQFRSWVFHFIVGGSTYSFVGGSSYPESGEPVGSYQSVEDNGASLIYTGTNSSGFYTLTLADGSVIVWNGGISSQIANWTRPDGTRLDYTYGANNRVTSNRGYAVIIQGNTKACVVNLAHTYVAPGGACPAGVPTVTYGYTTGSYSHAPLLTSVTKPDSGVTTYSYVGADHLGCIKAPGQSVCKITNQYGVCPEDPSDPSTHYTWRYRDPILFQQTATGETYSYDYHDGGYNIAMCNVVVTDPSTSNNGWQFSNAIVTLTTNTGAQTTVETTVGGMPAAIHDPLGRETDLTYTGNGVYSLSDATELMSEKLPEGNETAYDYDSRGNILEKVMAAKPGSGLSNIVATASYPSTCTAPKTCNKPISMTDARGAETDFTYDTSSGGMLSEMGPAPTSGAARPLKLYTYVQKYAYVLNSGGSLVAAASPVWLRSTMTECQTVAGSSTTSCDTSAPQRVTTYLYGADGTADNLLLHGIAVTADGQTLRTCYGYDALGNKISETKPRAGLAVCS